MTKHYLIGIGGTGARIMEAVTYLCAAGYGPDELSLFLIDPDQGNGNLSRTKTLIGNYNECQKRFQERNSHRVKLFRTRISTPPESMIWSIFDNQNATLGNYIHFDNLKQSQPALADLANVLFSHNELTEKLNEGFRGHPSIGAVVMAEPSRTNDPWKTFWNDVTTVSLPNDVRVFLVGSIFGGTGAAGVPTFGSRKMLKYNELAAFEKSSRIYLGGCLVLPYFAVDMNAESLAEHEGDLFVTHNDFPIATKAALQFYDEKEDLAFDELYFVGDSDAEPVGSFAPGAKKQENRAHYIELVSALSALDFFRAPARAHNDTDKRYFIGARDGTAVDWQSLPVTRDDERLGRERDTFKLLLSSMTIFSYTLATYGGEVLAMSDRDRPAWYRDDLHFGRKSGRQEEHDMALTENRTAVDLFAAFSRDFLQWMTQVADGNRRVQMVNASKLWNDRGELTDRHRLPNAIASLINASSKQLPFSSFIEQMNGIHLGNRGMRASDKYLNLFYESAVGYCEKNYGMSVPAEETR
ncbi:MAG TPA: hypothetical protein VEK57_00285 [Thermoanaerobaculia bacterium]|nr:hypothetical protein [Thermoanaerobaculia bacterium]